MQRHQGEGVAGEGLEPGFEDVSHWSWSDVQVTGCGQTPGAHVTGYWSWSDARGTLDKSPRLVDAVFLGPELDSQHQGPHSVVGLKRQNLDRRGLG